MLGPKWAESTERSTTNLKSLNLTVFIFDSRSQVLPTASLMGVIWIIKTTTAPDQALVNTAVLQVVLISLSTIQIDAVKQFDSFSTQKGMLPLP